MFTEMSRDEMVQTNGGLLWVPIVVGIILLGGCSAPKDECSKCTEPVV